jgi:Ca2+-binding RTX toxin-like protein
MATINLSSSTVPEDAVEGDTVGTLGIDGGAQGETFTFTLDDPRFKIVENENGGYDLVVKAGAEFDYEAGARQYAITVHAIGDQETPVAPLSVTVTVADVNEAPETSFSPEDVPEGAGAGTIVGTLTSSDPEQNPVSYTLLGNSADLFSIDVNGHVVVREGVTLDLDNPSHLSISVQIFDGTNTFTDTFDLNLVENQEPAVTFDEVELAKSVASGTTVGTLLASDNEDDPVAYTLVGASVALFDIDANGNVVVRDGVTLDYDNEAHRSFTVMVSDGVNEFEETFQLSNTNEPPEVTFEAKDVIEGASAGTVVATLSPADTEEDDVSFTLSSASANVFELVKIDDDTWNVVVKEGVVLDYDNVAHRGFTVTVSDGYNTDTAEYDLAMEDNQPPEFNVEIRTVRENAPAGAIVGIIDASDNEGDRLSYNLRGSSAYLFRVVEDTVTGDMNIVLREGAVLNYENAGHHSLEVLVSDGINEAVLETLQLDIEDVNENPVVAFAPVKVNEGAGVGKIVGTLTGTDEDGDDVTFTLSDDSAELFDLVDNGRGGYDIVVLDGVRLDYENATHHSVRVSVSDEENVLSRNFALSLTDLVDTITGTKRNDTLKGGSGSDIVKGLAGNDRLSGGAGADWLYGGSGRDVLIGDGGKDIFVFDSKQSKKTNLDIVWDYNVKDDSIWLDNKIFTKLGKKGSETNPAQLNKDFFVTGTKAKDKNDYLIYNKKTGYLSYDADGSGSKAAVEIALLKKGLAMTHKEFFVI